MMKIKTRLGKRVLPFFMALIMLFSAIAGVIPAMAAEISSQPIEGDSSGANEGAGTGEEYYYKIVFEDGMLRIQLNPQKIYEMLKDRSFSREELLKFVPEDVLATLEKGRDISIDDLKLLVSNYISASDLDALKEMLPTEVLREYFDLSMLEDILTIEEILSVISVDDLLAGIDEDAISDLITPAALKLLLNETAKEKVLTDTFVEDLLEQNDILDQILADSQLKADLAALIDSAIVDQLLADSAVKANLLALMEQPDVLDSILASTEGLNTLKSYFASKTTTVSAFLSDPEVVQAIKNIPSIHDSLINSSAINNLISLGVINKQNIREIFTDEQLETLVTDNVIERLLLNHSFVEGLIGDDELIDELVTDELLSALLDAGVFDGRIAPADIFPATVDWTTFSNTFGITVENAIDRFDLDEAYLIGKYGTDVTVEEILSGENISSADICLEYGITIHDLIEKGFVNESELYDPVILQDVLLSNASARAIVSDEIHHHPEISLTHYWEHLEFEALVNAIGVDEIKSFVNTHDDVYEKLLTKISGADITAALGEGFCTELLQNNASAILHAVGMTKFFEYFDRNEVVAALGGYYAVIQKGYVSEDAVVTAIGGYPALLDYLPLEKVIDTIGTERLLDFVNFNDIVASAGGYDKVLAWYTPEELQAIVNAIGTDRLQAFLTDSGILAELDLQKITSELLTIIKEKGVIQDLSQRLVDTVLTILNVEISSIHINDTQIYRPGRFDFEAIVFGILDAIPDMDHFLAMQENDPLAQWQLRANIRGEELTLGVSVEFSGDFTQLQELLQEHADVFRFDVSEELDLTVSSVLPAVTAEVYTKVLLSDRVPMSLKQKLLTAPQSMSISEFSTFLAEIPDDQLQTIADEISEKLDQIREKAYAALDKALGENAAKLESAKLKVDRVLDAFTSLEKIKSARTLAIKLLDRLPAGLSEQTLAELYQGESAFLFHEEYSADFYDRATALLQKTKLAEETVENMLLYFGNDLSIDGTLDLTVTTTDVYQLIVNDENEEMHIFYLPAGLPLATVKEILPSLNVTFEDGATMPAEDTTVGEEIWYTVEFYLEGEKIHEVGYLKGTIALDPASYPEIPERVGYFTPSWPTIELNQQEITRVYVTYERKPYTSQIVQPEFGVEDFTLYYDTSDRYLTLPIPNTAPHGYTFDTWYIDTNENGVIDAEDVRLERVVQRMMFRMLRATALEEAKFAVPDGTTLSEDMTLLAGSVVTEHTIVFRDAEGNLTGETATYNVFELRDDITARFPALPTTAAGYEALWYVEDTPWSEFDYYNADAALEISVKILPIEYTVTFTVNGTPVTAPDGTYTIEDQTITAPTLDAIAGYHPGVWFVVSVDGTPLSTPVALDSYTLSIGDLAVEAVYEPIEYTIKFVDGSNETTYFFNIRDQKLYDANGTLVTVLPTINVPNGYTAAWEYDLTTIGNKTVTPTLTLLWYTITFNDGQNATTLYFNIIDQKLCDAENGNEVSVPTWTGSPITGMERRWSDYDLSHAANQTVTIIDTPIIYEIKFVDGATTTTLYFNIFDQKLTDAQGNDAAEPSVQSPYGYDASWSYDLSQIGNKVISPTYTLRWYTITFADGATTATLYFNVIDQKLCDAENGNEVSVPTWSAPAAGYERTWSSYDLSREENQTVHVVDTPITYTAIFYNENGSKVGEVSYTVEGFLGTLPNVPDKNGYDGEWNYTSLTVGGMQIYPTYTEKSYTIYFKNSEGGTIGTVGYETNATPNLSQFQTLPDRTMEGYRADAWYVIRVNGQPVTPTKLSEFTFTYGDVVIEARYSPIEYTATFYDEHREIYTQIIFTVESGLTLPPLPSKAGYSGEWDYDGFRLEDLHIYPSYTENQYTAIFYDEDGNVIATITFTVNDTELTDIPDIPKKAGYRGKWYVITENGKELTPAILLEDYRLSDAVITLEPRYTPQKSGESDSDKIGDAKDDFLSGGMGWLWWIVLIIVLILLILAILWYLKKKNLPPFKKIPTPPAIVEAAIPEDEEIEEVQEAPIEVVESIDVQTADEAMSDDTAMAVVETLEVAGKVQGQRAIVNIHLINDAFEAGETVDLAALKAKKMIPAKATRIKILADGTLEKPLTVIADAFSVQAIKMITLTGGHAIQKKYNG